MNLFKLLTTNPSLRTLSFGFGMLFLMAGGIQQFLTPYFANIGHPEFGFRMLLIIYATLLIMSFLAPRIVTLLGIKRAILIAASTYLLSAAIVLTELEWLIYIGGFTFGLAGAVLWNSQNRYLIGISEESEFGANSGVFIATYTLGVSLGILLLSMVIPYAEYKPSFTGILLISGLSLIFFARLGKVSAGSGDSNFSDVLSVILGIFRKRFTLVTFSLYALLVYYVLGIVVATISLHISGTLGEEFVALLAIFYIVPILLAKYFGKVSDRIGREKVLRTGVVVAIAAFTVLFFSSSTFSFILAALLFAFANSLLTPTIMALPGDLSTSEQLGTVTGVFMVMRYVGMIGAIALGFLRMPQVIYGVSVLIFIFVALLTWQTLGRGLPEARLRVALEMRKKPASH